MTNVDLSYERVKSYAMLNSINERTPNLNLEGLTGMALQFGNSDFYKAYRGAAVVQGVNQVYSDIISLSEVEVRTKSQTVQLKEANKLMEHIDFHVQSNMNEPIAFFAGSMSHLLRDEVPDMLNHLAERFPNLPQDALERMLALELMQVAATSPGLNFQSYVDSVHEHIGTLRPECFGPDTPIDMWPLDPDLRSGPDGVFDQHEVRAKIWQKPIAMIRKSDTVVSFDKNGNLVPGNVTRTFENESKILLDYFGTRVTPGHVYFRPDSKKTDKFECLLDILRDDGMIQNVEGTNVRAATNVSAGDPRDGFVWAVTQERSEDGATVEKDRGRIRLGTRFIVDGKTSHCVADVIEAKGGFVGDDELIRFGDADPAPFVWDHGATLPKPEDFVLKASGTTVENIYKAGEWESRRPHMPAPMVMDGGAVQPLSATALSALPRNQPLNLQPAAATAPKGATRVPMNRKQRKTMEAKQRKAAKMRNRAAV